MPPPPKPRKFASKGSAANPARPMGKRGKKKKSPSPLIPQIVGGLTLAVVACLVGAGLFFGVKRAIPAPKPSIAVKDPAIVARPSIAPSLENQEPKRPGRALAPEDEVYAPKAHDIKAGDPLEPPINGLLAKGVLTLFADGKFRPNDKLPRAEFLVWCYNAVMAQTTPGPDPFISPKKGFPTIEATGEEFKDVPAEHWAAPVLAAIKHTNVFENVLDRSFRPDAPLTRQEWAGFAADLAVSKEVRAKLPDTIDATKLAVALRKLNYTDPTAIKEEFRAPVFVIASDEKRKSWITETFAPPELPGGWGPNKPVTRGEAAAWLGGAYDQIGLGLM